MPEPKNIRLIRGILYRLKREWGQEVVFTRLDTQAPDVRTGKLNQATTEVTVRRAIVLPKKMRRDFEYDLSYIAAAKNFTYGAYFGTSTRTMIVERKDLPSNFELLEKDHADFDGDKYQVKSIDKLPNNRGFLVTVEAIRNPE